jgi:hypothetical protein
MGQFQLVLGDRSPGPIRETWEEAAQDAVSAGVAAWVWDQFPNSQIIEWIVDCASINRHSPEFPAHPNSPAISIV